MGYYISVVPLFESGQWKYEMRGETDGECHASKRLGTSTWDVAVHGGRHNPSNEFYAADVQSKGPV